jgi:copper chaperone CopZ
MKRILGIGSRIDHPEYGKGVITNVDAQTYWVTFIDSGLETITIDSEFETIEASDDDLDTVSFYEVERSLRNILKKWSDVSEIVPIADKYKGGTLVLQPSDTSLANKEIPIDTFFHKIVMLRDRLRVMEQKINSSKNLDDQEKVDLQQYITRCYGSLTTFNVLFKNNSQQFKGEGGKKG